MSATPNNDERLAELIRDGGIELERRWLELVVARTLPLPDRAHVEMHGARPDFVYDITQVAVYVDGGQRLHAHRSERDIPLESDLNEHGWTVVRFGEVEDWADVFHRNPAAFHPPRWTFVTKAPSTPRPTNGGIQRRKGTIVMDDRSMRCDISGECMDDSWAKGLWRKLDSRCGTDLRDFEAAPVDSSRLRVFSRVLDELVSAYEGGNTKDEMQFVIGFLREAVEEGQGVWFHF